MKRFRKQGFSFATYVVWALFVNALTMWIVNPLVQDFAVLGVVAVFAITVIWLTSIPREVRKRWIMFTIFSLLVGQGLSNILFYPFARKIIFGLIMCIGLFVIAYFVTRIRGWMLAGTILVLVGANAWLPLSEWPFLTHFNVSYYNQLSMAPSDIPTLPFVPIQTSDGGHALITIERTTPSTASLLKSATQATTSPDALSAVLRSYRDRYQFVEIKQQANGRFATINPTTADLAQVDPLELTSSFFPFTRAYWLADGGHMLQYMGPAQSAQQATELALEPANYDANMRSFARLTAEAEQTSWDQALQQLGVSAAPPNLQIVDGVLRGRFAGHDVAVKVDGAAVIGTGSFTSPGAQQILVQGANELQIVDVNNVASKVLTTYHATPEMPLPNDIVVGPLENKGIDAIFVNASPAYILQASADGRLKTAYVAPNPSLRFEASVAFPADKTPEILTDDPSAMRDIPTRYFTSYTYSHGNLKRNWRIYRTNIVNVRSMQFAKNGPSYVVTGIYSSGQFLILKRHDYPVLPIAATLFGLTILAGWILKWRQRGGRPRA